ncbi:MAG: bifunctional phosphoglucose/phosphomannose isomerase [Chloroflexota bacterium]
MADLDDARLYSTFDPTNMLARIDGLPRQCLQAWRGALDFTLPADYSTVDKVVVLGMGGSAIGGDLLRCLALEQSTIPVAVHRDYDLPPWVDERTLVIASSYSGNTEETVSSFSAALSTPARKLVVTTGGRLKALAEEARVPVLHLDTAMEPRTAFGYSFFSLLGFAQKLGIVSLDRGEVEETLRIAEEGSATMGRHVPAERNTAKQLATRLGDRLIVVYGAGVLSPVAFRWKTQFNENSKESAFAETLPELNHNSVVGYNLPPWLAGRTSVVMLRSSLLNPRILKRYDVTAELLTNAGFACEFVDARGRSSLAHMVSTVHVGDYASYYLALLNSVDPSPVAVIDRLKRRLAEPGG